MEFLWILLVLDIRHCFSRRIHRNRRDFVANHYIGLLLPYVACAVRRVRDASGNGWFILIPVYNLILLLSKSKTEDKPNS